jgi:hypothetical protein
MGRQKFSPHLPTAWRGCWRRSTVHDAQAFLGFHLEEGTLDAGHLERLGGVYLPDVHGDRRK